MRFYSTEEITRGQGLILYRSMEHQFKSPNVEETAAN